MSSALNKIKNNNKKQGNKTHTDSLVGLILRSQNVASIGSRGASKRPSSIVKVASEKNEMNGCI